MEEIESETKFIWKTVLHILLTPVTLILILFGKKEFKDLFQPFLDIVKFIFEPKFTITIIIINIIIFIINYLLDNSLTKTFANYPADLIGLKLYTLVTAGFLHADPIHLLVNMLGIFIFGRVVERKLGPIKTGLIYFGALIISSLFSSLINLFILKNNVPGIGASGALMGLVAAAILLDPFYITYELIIPLPVMVVGWIAIYADLTGIINRVQDNIGHFAHLGGFISIALLMFLLGVDDRRKLAKGLLINLVSLGIGLIIYFFVI